MPLILLLALPFAGSVVAALMPTNARNAAALWSAAVALVVVVQLALLFPEVRDGGVVREEFLWLPAAGLDLVIRIDGFAWMFGMLVSGIGLLVVLYARYYMSAADPVPRFFSFFLAFMGSMLGLVLSGNLIQLVFFWELTSLLSFLLIGYWHHRARRAPRCPDGADGHRRRRALPSRRRPAARPRRAAATTSTRCSRPATECARTTCTCRFLRWCCSARSPRARSFRFTSGYRTRWRRRRRSLRTCIPPRWSRPASSCWHACGRSVGHRAVVLDGRRRRRLYACRGCRRCDVPARPEGPACLLDDQPPRPHHAAARTRTARSPTVAAVFHMMNHATFKASLFMAAGVIDHETGTRDLARLNGLWKAMPITGTLAMVASAAMAGVPLLNGFLSKEMFFAETRLRRRDARRGGGSAGDRHAGGDVCGRILAALRLRDLLRRSAHRPAARAARALAVDARADRAAGARLPVVGIAPARRSGPRSMQPHDRWSAVRCPRTASRSGTASMRRSS